MPSRIQPVCLLLLACIAAQASPAAMAESLVERAQQIAARQPEYAQWWPGFWPEGQPFLLYEPGGGCVFYSPDLVPVGFEPAAMEQPGFWRGQCQGPAFQAPMQFLQEVAGVRTNAFRVDGRRSAIEQFVVHEAFHAFQFCAFERRTQGSLHDYDFPLDPELVRSKLREALLLFEAVAQTSDAARADLVRLVLASRAQRLSAMPEAARSIEDAYMRSEGTAEFIEYLSMGLAPGVETAKRLAGEAMRADIPSLSWEWLLRWQSYRTGAASAFLLEAMGVPEWRQRVMRGDAFYDLLAEASGYFQDEAASLAERADAIPLPSVERTVAALIKHRSAIAKARARYDRAARHRLVIRPPSDHASVFKATRMGSLDGHTVVFDPTPLTTTGSHLELTVRKRPIRLGMKQAEEDVVGIEVALTKPPGFKGCEPAQGVSQCPAGTVIASAGMSLNLKQAAFVERADATTRVWFAGEADNWDDRDQRCGFPSDASTAQPQ
jgi:hypothetical protein